MDERGDVSSHVARLLATRGRRGSTADDGGCAARRVVTRASTGKCAGRFAVEHRCAVAGDRCRTVIAWRRLRCCAVVRHVIGVHAWLVRLIRLGLIWVRLTRLVYLRLVDLQFAWLGPPFKHLARFASRHVDIERVACADVGSWNRFARQGRRVECVATRGCARRRCIARGWLFNVDIHVAFELRVTFNILVAFHVTGDFDGAIDAFGDEPSPREPLERCRRRVSGPQRDIEPVRRAARLVRPLDGRAVR
jgi:hypothetical protein